MSIHDALKNQIQFIKNQIQNGEVLILFGAGEKAKGVVSLLENNDIIPECFCDNDPSKWNKEYLGYKIYSLEDLMFNKMFFIGCVAINYFEEIKTQISFFRGGGGLKSIICARHFV